MKHCIIEGCEREVRSKEMCSTHYRRSMRGVDISKPMVLRFDSKTCLVEGCAKKKHSRGMCSMHHSREKRWGDVNYSIRHFWEDLDCKGLWHGAKLRSKRDKLPFNIPPESIVIPKTCPVLGIPLIKGVKIFTDNSPTLDKIVPEKGYVVGNVHVISYLANRIKTNATFDQILKVGEYFKRLNESME